MGYYYFYKTKIPGQKAEVSSIIGIIK